MRHDASKYFIVIPARLASTRLPRKVLRDVAGVPMIVRVWRQAVAAHIGRVVVACDGGEIADVISDAGGEAVITPPDLPSGSDRVAAALAQIDPEKNVPYIINLQGDLPQVPPSLLVDLATALAESDFDVMTAVAPLDAAEKTMPQVVKAAIAWGQDGTAGTAGTALYFSRAPIPHGGVIGGGAIGGGTMWHHIGIYGWRRGALERFVALPPSPLEIAETLEQLRALEAGMRIGVVAVDKAIAGVDTEADLQIVAQSIT